MLDGLSLLRRPYNGIPSFDLDSLRVNLLERATAVRLIPSLRKRSRLVPTNAHEHDASVFEDSQNCDVDDSKERVRSEIQHLQDLLRSHRPRMGGKSVELNLHAVWHRATEPPLCPLERGLQRTEKEAVKLLPIQGNPRRFRV